MPGYPKGCGLYPPAWLVNCQTVSSATSLSFNFADEGVQCSCHHINVWSHLRCSGIAALSYWFRWAGLLWTPEMLIGRDLKRSQSSQNTPSHNSQPLSPVPLADASEAERKSKESPPISLLPGAMAWQHNLQQTDCEVLSHSFRTKNILCCLNFFWCGKRHFAEA